MGGGLNKVFCGCTLQVLPHPTFMSPFYAFLTSDAADAAAAAAAQPSVLGPALVCHFPTAEGKTRPASRVASQPATLFLFLPLPLLLLCFFVPPTI